MLGFTIGWTMLTAMLVGRVGITYLPLLFVVNAILVIGSTIFFSELIHRFSKTKLIYSTVLSGVILLIGAIFVFQNSENLWLFLGITLAAESIFFAQLNILLGLFIEDLFTPLEGNRTFPIIETSEYIGGIAGGALILGGLELFHLEAAQLIWAWVASFGLILPALFLFNKFRKKLPTLEVEEEKSKISSFEKFREGKDQIRKFPFLTGLVFVVLLQWMFFTLLNFQYTKAVDESITIGAEESGQVNAHADKTNGVFLSTENFIKTKNSHSVENSHMAAETSHEDLLTHGLGKLHIIFYTIALFIQLFLTSRIIEKLGIVKTLRMHPLASLGSSLLMIAKPGFGSAVFAKGLFESTTGVYSVAYHASFYALREKVRGSVKEFMEGLIKPAGVLAATGIIFVLQKFFVGSELIFATNIALITAAVGMSFLLFKHQKNYTKIPENNLHLMGNHPAKFQSIEILAEAGHVDAAGILMQKLTDPNESPLLKIKILEALGKLGNPKTVFAILECFHDRNEEVRIAAVNALGNFKNLDEKAHAFTHHRVINALKKLFAEDNTPELRSGIIHAFANFKHSEAVEFLVKELQNKESPIRGDCVYVCGQFRDLGIAHYLEPYLKSSDVTIRANAIIALWQFQQFRSQLTQLLAELLDIEDRETQKTTIHLLGEIRAKQESPRLLNFLEEEDAELRLLASLALGKLENPCAIHIIAEFILHPNLKLAEHAKKQLCSLPEKMRKGVEKVLHHRLSEKLNGLLVAAQTTTANKISHETLVKIRKVYELADEWDEVAKVDAILGGYCLA